MLEALARLRLGEFLPPEDIERIFASAWSDRTSRTAARCIALGLRRKGYRVLSARAAARAGLPVRGRPVGYCLAGRG